MVIIIFWQASCQRGAPSKLDPVLATLCRMNAIVFVTYCSVTTRKYVTNWLVPGYSRHEMLHRLQVEGFAEGAIIETWRLVIISWVHVHHEVLGAKRIG